jgi:hypothetical protein
MARRNRNKQKSKDNNNTVNTEVIAQKVEQLQKDSEISTEELMSEEDVQVPSNLKIKSLESIYQQAIKVHKQLETRKIEYSKKITSVDEQMEKLKKEINDYETKKLELNESIKKYDDELKEINKLRIGNFVNIIDKKVIDEYSKSLDEQKELLLIEIKKLKNEQAKYLQLIANKEQEIISSKTEITKEKLRLEREFEIKFTEKEQELEESKRKIEKQQKELQYSLEDFEDEKKYLEDKARKKVENEIITLKDSISTLEQKNSLLLEEIEELKDIYRYLGGRDPKKIIDELNDAKDEIYSLQGKLELSPDSLDIDELKKLRRDKINWKADLDEAYASLNDYKQRWEKEQLSIGEKETLEFQKEELEKRIELQKESLKEFQSVLDKSNAVEVFSSCIEMDKEYKDAENMNYPNNYFSIEWITTLQQKFARRKVPLYYDENVIRSFVSGLAMSRLNILQGISGTGKTSLPEAFADAVGGYFQTIEVQSGWKDRQDLIGYYNTFEKKFYESDFLKALYKANTPKYRNKPFFIILDEMNLSHPEHYFADLLSLMEKTNFNDQKLKICDKVNGKPELMIDEDGTFKLQIPDNVWFIGTANNDETTLQFAPKTYDRANIMEMPKNYTSITKDDKVDLDFVLTDANGLLENFSLADEEDTTSFHSYLAKDGNFKKICNKLGIGWGNRLEKQMDKFIPNFIQLGGTEADAMDHIISSKILRNIQGRYDLQEKILNEMKDELENNFINKFGDLPEKSLEIIEQELEKK